MGYNSYGGPPESGSDSSLTSPPTPMPTPTDEGDALGPPDASTSALRDALDEPILTIKDSGADQLLSTAVPDGLSDPYSSAQGGWDLGPKNIDPYTTTPADQGILSSFVGQDVNLYSNIVGDGGNPNAFIGDMNINPFTGFQNDASFTGRGDTASASPILAFGIPIAPLDFSESDGSIPIAPWDETESDVPVPPGLGPDPTQPTPAPPPSPGSGDGQVNEDLIRQRVQQAFSVPELQLVLPPSPSEHLPTPRALARTPNPPTPPPAQSQTPQSGSTGASATPSDPLLTQPPLRPSAEPQGPELNVLHVPGITHTGRTEAQVALDIQRKLGVDPYELALRAYGPITMHELEDRLYAAHIFQVPQDPRTQPPEVLDEITEPDPYRVGFRIRPVIGTARKVAQLKTSGQQAIDQEFAEGVLSAGEGLRVGAATGRLLRGTLVEVSSLGPQLRKSLPPTGPSFVDVSSLGPQLRESLPPTSPSFEGVIDPSEFENDPTVIDRLDRAREFDIGGYDQLQARGYGETKGRVGRVGDNLDSDEALQNAYIRQRLGADRDSALTKDNPAMALSPENHRTIQNLRMPQMQGLNPDQVLQFHLLQMAGFAPDFALQILERLSQQYIKKTF